MIQVYTGDGKGKTTAAVGLAARASGQGLSVRILQFLKGREETGEIMAARKLGIVIRQYGSGRWLMGRRPEPEELSLAETGLREAKEALEAGIDLVILDEISHAVNLGLLSIEQVLILLKDCPDHTELVLTGRNMPEEIISRADLVTKMQEVKHPYHRGVGPRRGIEY